MQEKALYEYAVIRVLPRVDREEFLNVGVLLYCQPRNFLRSACSINEDRLKPFVSGLRPEILKEHLAAVERICNGGDDAGPIGQLPIGERFRWLTAPRSTVVQTSAVHTGLTDDPEATLQDLMKKLVY
ncbi:MAG: DUF3037 domain-containing protein [Pyrinomonadaceae bacterium]